MKKIFTLLTLALMSIGSAWAQTTIYSWEGNSEGAVESGGVMTANNAGVDCSADDINMQNSVYYVARLRGAKDYSTYVLAITLNKALIPGDQIKVTAFRNKNDVNKQTGFLAKFDKGGSVTTVDSEGLNGCEFVNIDTSESSAGDKNRGTEPNTITVIVPEAASGSKTITATRAITGTNLFITKIEIVRPASDVVLPVGSFTSDALNVAPGASVTAPELSILNAADDSDISSKYTIAYSSSNTNVVTVNAETGAIALVGTNEGTAKITATFTPNEEGYNGGSASYTVNVASELTYPYSWDFTTFETSGTWDKLAADATNWGAKGENTYQSLVEMKGIIAASGVTIPETKFIKFGTFAKNKIYINKGSLQLNGSKLTISIPNLKAGYYVSVDFENPSGSDSRGLTLANVNETAENKLGVSTRETRLFTVKEDGDVTLTSTSGVRIYGIKVTIEAPTTTVNTTNGYATFCSTAAYDFSASGAKVYKAAINGNTAVLTEVSDGKVPANTGVIICGNASVIGSQIYTAEALTGNELVGVIKDYTTKGNYILVADGESVKFAEMNEGTLAAGKAYLPKPAESAPELTIVMAGTTGITNVETAGAEGAIYNLNGVRVVKPAKGLYIQNGKKFVVK